MNPGSRVEISASAYRKNVGFLRSVVGPETVLSSVVKSNAYGHGVAQMVPLAERCDVRHFCVYSASEALDVKNVASAGTEILVLGFLDASELEWAIGNDVAFVVFDQERLDAAREIARRLGRPARVHLELETGMNRTGLRPCDLESVIERAVVSEDALDIEGVCTHFAGAESEGNYVRVQQQIGAFHKLVGQLRQAGLRPRLRHTASSAATLTYPETRLDLVRVGIAQYGFWPSQETRMRFLLEHDGAGKRPSDPLKRVIRWITEVMSVQPVPPGEFVGYGRHYLTTRPQRIATIPVGYGHGFPRALSNLGHVLVRGRRAPVVGVVNMNCSTIDVTEIPGVQEGDEVVLIGRQGRQEVSVGWFGDLTRSLNYEVLVRIARDIPRRVVH